VVIVLASLIVFLANRRSREVDGGQTANPATAPKRRRSNFLEKTMDGLLVSTQGALGGEELARSRGFLQALDSRVKLVGLVALITASVAVHRLSVLLTLFGVGVLLGAFSRISPYFLLGRLWTPVLAFTGTLAVPALFTVPGQTIAQVPVVGWAVSLQGLLSALFLVVRAETASTFSLLLVLCTPWNQLLRALRFCRVPTTAVVILQMTHRYLFLLVDTAHNMLEARRARVVGYLDSGERRRLLAATAGVLLDKTLHLGREVHFAMLARGFRGDVHLLDDREIQVRDGVLLAGFLLLAGLLFWLGQ
jgi:cobalt ECF transporter T component CbiQ